MRASFEDWLENIGGLIAYFASISLAFYSFEVIDHEWEVDADLLECLWYIFVVSPILVQSTNDLASKVHKLHHDYRWHRQSQTRAPRGICLPSRNGQGLCSWPSSGVGSKFARLKAITRFISPMAFRRFCGDATTANVKEKDIPGGLALYHILSRGQTPFPLIIRLETSSYASENVPFRTLP